MDSDKTPGWVGASSCCTAPSPHPIWVVGEAPLSRKIYIYLYIHRVSQKMLSLFDYPLLTYFAFTLVFIVTDTRIMS